MLRLALAALFLCGFALPASASRWQLDFEPGKVASITRRGSEGVGNYVYMTFKLTNNSGEDVPLQLGMDVATEVPGRKYRGGSDPMIQRAVERYHLKRQFKRLSEVNGTTLADGDSLECLVIFGKVDPQVSSFSVSVTGLLDSVYVDKHKAYKEEKALELNYHRGGDDRRRQQDSITFKSKKWKVIGDRRPVKRGS